MNRLFRGAGPGGPRSASPAVPHGPSPGWSAWLRHCVRTTSRPPALSLCALIALGVLGSWGARPVQAQVPGLASADALHPAPLPDGWAFQRKPMPPSPELPATLDAAIRRWQSANRSVAEFPRGHVDLLRWEQGQSSADNPASPGTAAAPLTWAEVWRQVQQQQADRILDPRANAPERLAATQAWRQIEREARQAWVQAITQQALLGLQQERLHAARTAHALGERMTTLGHWSRARFIPVQQALVQEQAGLVRAQWQARQSLETLARQMGLWQAGQVQALATRLPATLAAPPAVTPPANAEGQALAQRPELQWQRETTARSVQAISDAQWLRWQQARDAALTRAGEPLTLSAPQWPPGALPGDHALDKALREQLALQRETSALRRQVRLAWDRLQATQALDQLQQQHAVPLAEAAEQETLLRYNGMLQSTWDVLDAARARLGAQAEALSARQDHWLASIDWHTLMAGGDVALPADLATGQNSATPGKAKGH